MAIVKALTTVFYDGHRRRPGDIFEFNGKIKGNPHIEVVDEPAEVKAEIPLTVEQIRGRLDGYGVRYSPRAGIERLQEMLDEAEGRKPVE